jgi:putative FmdB family regulatory protein
MPKYEYDCMRCAKRYTQERSIKEDDPGYNCETCNKPLVRVYSTVGAVFNGSGFYSTDNRKGK